MMPYLSVPSGVQLASAALVALTLSATGCADLTESQRLVLTIDQLDAQPWPAQMVIQGVDTVEVRVVDGSGDPVGVREIEWTSSDPNVLGVAAVAPTGSTVADTLAAARRAELTGQATGTATLTVTIERPGVERAEYSASITVSTLAVAKLDWPAAVPVGDTVILRLQFPDSGGKLLRGADFDWKVIDEDQVDVEKLARDSIAAAAFARARGWASIEVRIERAGFESVSFIDSLLIVERWSQVSGGRSHACAVAVEGEAFCWGSGVLGDGTLLGGEIPVQVGDAGLRFKSISAGVNHACGISTDNALLCWGFNRWGEVGVGAVSQTVLLPTQIGFGGFQQVSVGGYHVCGLTTTLSDRGGVLTTVVCWGLGGFGQLGHGDASQFGPCLSGTGLGSTIGTGGRFGGGEQLGCQPEPGLQVMYFEAPGPDFSLFVDAIDAGEFHTCGDGYCWGANESEQLGLEPFRSPDNCALEFIFDHNGNGSSGTFNVPCIKSALPTGSFADNQTTAGSTHTCALTDAGAAWCWGDNEYGQLGAPMSDAMDPSSTCDVTELISPEAMRTKPCTRSPLAVRGGLTFESIDAGHTRTCGIDVDGYAYCWGNNSAGTDVCTIDDFDPFPSNDVPCSREPVRVSDQLRFAQVTAGLGPKMCGITVPDGAIYCWQAFGSGATPPERLPEPEP